MARPERYLPPVFSRLITVAISCACALTLSESVCLVSGRFSMLAKFTGGKKLYGLTLEAIRSGGKF